VKGLQDSTEDEKWQTFDYAVWTESMNTVLEDSKEPQLSSGEVMKMREVSAV